MTTETATCRECGLALDDPRHLAGVGLHGHQSTSPEEADDQRRAAISSAGEFDPNNNVDRDQQNLAYDTLNAMATRRYAKDLIKAGRGDEVVQPNNVQNPLARPDPGHDPQTESPLEPPFDDTPGPKEPEHDPTEHGSTTDGDEVPPATDEPEPPTSGGKGKK